jgi:glycerate-2-kinase
MKIKNSQALMQNKLRKAAIKILEAGLEAIDTENVIKKTVRLEDGILFINDKKIDLTQKNRLIVVGIGKCSMDSAAALEEILGDRINDGMIIDVKCDRPLKYIKTREGDHPLPTDRNVNYTKEMINLLDGLGEDDLVLIVVSGGGSTLLCQPQNFTHQEESKIIKYLLNAGATIQEINTVRKHISLARGGHLAKYAWPAEVVSLIFSDVPGDDMEFIASGPTVKDTTTIKDAQRIIKKYNVEEKSNFSDDNLIETPKEDKYFKKVTNMLVISNLTALKAMAQKAGQLGFEPEICTSYLIGEARIVGRNIAEELNTFRPKTALLYGGETTVTVKGKGTGGRNQELVLGAIPFIKKGWLISSLASDGWDNTDAAGAIYDIITKEKAEKLGLDSEKFLTNNDSYNFFQKTGDFIKTGHTGSNVADLVIAMKE